MSIYYSLNKIDSKSENIASFSDHNPEKRRYFLKMYITSHHASVVSTADAAQVL